MERAVMCNVENGFQGSGDYDYNSDPDDGVVDFSIERCFKCSTKNGLHSNNQNNDGDDYDDDINPNVDDVFLSYALSYEPLKWLARKRLKL